MRSPGTAKRSSWIPLGPTPPTWTCSLMHPPWSGMVPFGTVTGYKKNGPPPIATTQSNGRNCMLYSWHASIAKEFSSMHCDNQAIVHLRFVSVVSAHAPRSRSLFCRSQTQLQLFMVQTILLLMHSLASKVGSALPVVRPCPLWNLLIGPKLSVWLVMHT